MKTKTKLHPTDRKFIRSAVICELLLVAALYLIGSLIAWNFNIADWHVALRVVMVLCAIPTTIFNLVLNAWAHL